jgi:hypothetical protein
MRSLGLVMHETVFRKTHKESCDLVHNLSSLSLTQLHHSRVNPKITGRLISLQLRDIAKFLVDLAGFEPAASSVQSIMGAVSIFHKVSLVIFRLN